MQNEFLDNLAKRAVESEQYKKIVANGIVEAVEITSQTERIQKILLQLETDLTKEQFDTVMRCINEISVLRLIVDKSASSSEVVLKTALQILSLIGSDELERYGKLDTALQGGTLPNGTLLYNGWKIQQNSWYSGYCVMSPSGKTCLSGSLAAIEEKAKKVCGLMSVVVPEDGNEEQASKLFPPDLQIVEIDQLVKQRFKQAITEEEFIAARAAVLEKNDRFVQRLAYRCALIADAVYRKENLADYGIPEATEKQWQDVFGYSFKKKLDNKSIRSTKFHLYYDERSEQFVLAFAGTLPTQMKDWWNNIQQFSGKDTPYYEQAIEIAELIQPAYRDKVMITGHSLGGGLATTAAIAVKLKAVVFNPPFIHANTLAKFNADSVEFAKQAVQRFVVNDEILHSVNQLTGVLKDELIPVGEKFALQGSDTDVSAAGTMTGAAIASLLGLGAFKETAGRALQKGIALHLMPEVLGGLVRYYSAE